MNLDSTSLMLPHLHNEELEKLIESNSTRVFLSAKSMFTTPGNDLGGVYYLKSGRTKHYMANEDGLEKMLYSLTPGWMFGEMLFSLGMKSGLFCVAEEDTVLYKISNEKCKALLDSSTLFRDALIKCLASKLFITRYDIENLTFNSCKNRILRLLCSSVDKGASQEAGWYDLKAKYTYYEVGVIVGAARVTVSKLMNDLVNDGVIRNSNKKVQINAAKCEEYIEDFSKPWLQ
jgi:CRP/FNR family cyclic AMP-dependent transcriptional regulator